MIEFLEVKLKCTQYGNSRQFDMIVKSYVSEAVDEVDELSEVIKERLVSLFYFLHFVL
jgi:hypothetical protein